MRDMDRRATCGMLACCVLVAHLAALGHAHGVGSPAGHDLRPHLHLAGGHVHAPSSEVGGHSHHHRSHGGHSHDGHGGHAHHSHRHADPTQEAATYDDASPATYEPEASAGTSPAGTGWRCPAGEHDDDALYLAVAAAGTSPARDAFLKGVASDGVLPVFLPADPSRLAANAGCGADRLRRPPRDGCALVARFLLIHAFRC